MHMPSDTSYDLVCMEVVPSYDKEEGNQPCIPGIWVAWILYIQYWSKPKDKLSLWMFSLTLLLCYNSATCVAVTEIILFCTNCRDFQRERVKFTGSQNYIYVLLFQKE
jgi:hypothetical protein